VAAGLGLTERWSLSLAGDVGGFGVGSDLTWAAQGILGYRLPLGRFETILGVGYQALSWDYEDNAFGWDVTQQGPIVGGTIRFYPHPSTSRACSCRASARASSRWPRVWRRATSSSCTLGSGVAKRLGLALGHGPLEDELGKAAERLVSGPDAVLVVDDTCLVKQGRRSVGVKRQYCGRLGKKANSDVRRQRFGARRRDPAALRAAQVHSCCAEPGAEPLGRRLADSDARVGHRIPVCSSGGNCSLVTCRCDPYPVGPAS
jgi:hypothetical protein